MSDGATGYMGLMRADIRCRDFPHALSSPSPLRGCQSLVAQYSSTPSLRAARFEDENDGEDSLPDEALGFTAGSSVERRSREYEALVYRPVICAYVVLLRYGLRISRKHWIKSFSDLSRVHGLRHFKMEGLGSR
jgi:hypothetical protein